MKILLKQIEVVDSTSEFNHQVVDILIVDGVIQDINKNISVNDAELIDQEGLSVSSGWCDMQVSSGDPGLEYKEDVDSLLAAAAKGGFTTVCMLPNTQPVIQSKEGVVYLKAKAHGALVNLKVIGALTKDCKGKDLTEMFDMIHQGAVAFSDGKEGTTHSGIVLKGLQYLYKNNKVLITRPFDKYLSHDGLMHEGIQSTLNGMKGLPSIAEYTIVKRDLDLLKYAGGRLHFSAISSKESVELIKEAKENGLQVTCDVAVPNLLLTDAALADFDTNAKVFPPLRSEADRLALIEGLMDGTIDCIVSDHSPQDVDAKKLEFDYADFGMIGLESAFALLMSCEPKLSLDLIVEKLTRNPKNILGLSNTSITQGQKADLTIFSKSEKWTFSKNDIVSKCDNTPFLGRDLNGRVKAVINNGQLQKFN